VKFIISDAQVAWGPVKGVCKYFNGFIVLFLLL